MADRIIIHIDGDNKDILKDLVQTDKALEKMGDTAEDEVDELEKFASDMRDEFKKLDRQIDKSENNLEGLSQKAGKAGKLLGIGLAGAVGGIAFAGASAGAAVFSKTMAGLTDIVTGALPAYRASRDAAIEQEAVLKATGHAAGLTQEQLAAHAKQLQDTTRISDDATTGLQNLILTFKNVRGDEFLRATELAQDMAIVMKTDLSSAGVQLGKALNDPIRGMTALSRAGVTFTQQQKDQVEAMLRANDVTGAQNLILDELQSQFGGTAKAMGDNGGMMAKLANRYDDVQERVGELIDKGLKVFFPVIEGGMVILENFISVVEAAMVPLENWIRQFTVSGDDIRHWAEVLVETYTIAEFSVANLDKLFEKSVTKYKLGLVTMWEDSKHFLGSTIPELLNWFAENWTSVLTDLANIQKTILSNMWQNYVAFFKGIRGWLKGDEGDFEFTALTEGFETTIKELPKVAGRSRTDLEKALKKSLGDSQKGLDDDFQRRLEKNLEILDFFTTKAKRAAPDFGNNAEAVDAAQFFKREEEKTKKQKDERAKRDRIAAAKKPKGLEEESFDASSEALRSLNKRISEAAASQTFQKLGPENLVMNPDGGIALADKAQPKEPKKEVVVAKAPEDQAAQKDLMTAFNTMLRQQARLIELMPFNGRLG